MGATIEYLGEYHYQFRLVCPCGKSHEGNWAYDAGEPILCPCGKAYHVNASGKLFDITQLRHGDKIVWPEQIAGEKGRMVRC